MDVLNRQGAKTPRHSPRRDKAARILVGRSWRPSLALLASCRFTLSTGLIALLAAPALASPPLPVPTHAAPAPPPDVRPDPSAKWEASIRDVDKVLTAAAVELMKHVPERRLAAILVEPQGGPIVLYKRGPKGEFRVKLNTGKTYWAQYTYQFAHEMCHILCEYDSDKNPCKWFEESICELASLFVLRRSAVTWKTRPPYPNWKSFAKHLDSYAEDRIRKAALPPGKTLAAWYRENREALRKNATDRPKNNIVAVQLLPLFEKVPSRWQAVQYLNKEKLDDTYDLKRYLEAWHRHCPAKHRTFVREIATKFEIKITP